MTEIRNTCTHSTLWKSTLGARVLFKMKIKAPLIQPPELCVWGYSKGFPFLFSPFFFSFLPFPHTTITPTSLWMESQYLGQFFRRYFNLKYGSIPPNLENPESVLILFEADEQGFVVGSALWWKVPGETSPGDRGRKTCWNMALVWAS